MKIKKCRKCGTYSLEDRCPSCGSTTWNPKPASFSPQDRYGKYRRKLKRNQDGY